MALCVRRRTYAAMLLLMNFHWLRVPYSTGGGKFHYYISFKQPSTVTRHRRRPKAVTRPCTIRIAQSLSMACTPVSVYRVYLETILSDADSVCSRVRRRSGTGGSLDAHNILPSIVKVIHSPVRVLTPTWHPLSCPDGDVGIE